MDAASEAAPADTHNIIVDANQGSEAGDALVTTDSNPNPNNDAGLDSNSTVDGNTQDTSLLDGNRPDTNDTGTTLDSGVDVVAPDSAANDARPDGTPGTDSGSDAGMTIFDAGIVDAANPFGDAGPLGPPPWVPLTVTTNSCPAFTPCGGNVVGTWDVSGGCVEIPIGTALALCPTAVITNRSGIARGRVTFDAVTARRVAQSIIDVSAFVPTVCANFVGGCAGLQNTIRNEAPSAVCTTTPSGCDCVIHEEFTINDSDGYTTMFSEIIGTVSQKHWGYCIDQNALRYDDRSPSGSREPGIIDLVRR